MHTYVGPVLARLRQDIGAILSPEAIREACRQAGYSWRNRKLDPVATISLFLLQVLNGNTACQHVVHYGRWAFSATAFCKARKRLPLRVLQSLVEMVAAGLRSATAESADWRGHRVWMIDGSGFSMPDVPELQAHFGSPSNQRPGCGFPVGHLVGLFDLATGMLLRMTISPMRVHDMSQASHLACELEPGDVALGDTGFCSYAHLAMLLARGNRAVFRMHQKQIVDFTPGRSMATRRSSGANLEGLPHSLWVRSNGPLDQVVIWYKPKQKPRRMTAERFAELPAEITVRELRYEVSTPGFRVRVITPVTTLLDPSIYPKVELAELYRDRWRIELNLRHIKITMKMDSLHCKTVEGVMKELAMFALAYDLVRSAMSESARGRKVAVERMGFLDALRWLTNPIPGGDPSDILINPRRPDRIEPRVIKRRMKKYPLMKEPRKVLRNRLMGQEVAA
jgi:Transposase DDE domain